MKKRLALVTAALLVAAGSGVSYAQIPVTDLLALAKHVAMTLLQNEVRDVRQEQAERVYKMSLRLSQWTTLSKYAIDRDDQPEWRIHDYFTDDVLYAQPYHYALTYGDAQGTGYDQVTIPRRPADGIWDGLPPDATAVVRADLALIDLADSAIIRGTHETGRIRFNGRDEAEAIIAFDTAVTDDDVDDSLAASLDRMSASALVEARNKQTRTELEAATLEQLLVEQAWDRSGETALNNLRLRVLAAAQGGEDALPSVVDHATEAITTWHLP